MSGVRGEGAGTKCGGTGIYSQGACPNCGGTGSVRTVDIDSLVPDDSISIDDGAVAPWNSLMWSLMTDVCREMGVRTDVPFVS